MRRRSRVGHAARAGARSISECWRFANIRSRIANGTNGCEERRAKCRWVLELGEARDATFVVECEPAVERVVPLIGADSHQEVAGHADAVKRDAAATPDFDHEDRQRDRDPEPAVEHGVEVRVVGVGVVDRVSRVSEIGEQCVRECIGVVRIERRRKRVELRATLRRRRGRDARGPR